MERPVPGALLPHHGLRTPSEEPTLGATSNRLAALFPGEGEPHRWTEPELFGLYSQAEEGNLLTGRLELYPTWLTNTGEFNTQNLFEAVLKTGENTSVNYIQYWNTNLYKPSAPNQGLSPYLWEGLIGVRVNNLYKDDSGLSIGTQQKILLPTYYTERDAGLITGWVPRISVKKDLGEVVSLSVYDEAFLYGYRLSGYNGNPNPILQNWFVVELDFNITKHLTASFPIQYIATRFRDYSLGTPFNNAWQHFVQIWPSINYQVTDNLSLGIYWLSDSFVKNDFTGFTLSNAFRNGAVQFNTAISF